MKLLRTLRGSLVRWIEVRSQIPRYDLATGGNLDSTDRRQNCILVGPKTLSQNSSTYWLRASKPTASLDQQSAARNSLAARYFADPEIGGATLGMVAPTVAIEVQRMICDAWSRVWIDLAVAIVVRRRAQELTTLPRGSSACPSEDRVHVAGNCLRARKQPCVLNVVLGAPVGEAHIGDGAFVDARVIEIVRLDRRGEVDRVARDENVRRTSTTGGDTVDA